MLTTALHGGDTVTWTATFATDTQGVTLNWEWGAAVYTSFSTTYSSLNVKPCDSSTASSYANADSAGIPESSSYRTHVTTGAKGTTYANSAYTFSYSSAAAVTPTVNNTFINGNLFNDLSANGQFSSTDPALSGWTVYLYTETSGVVSSTPLQTTTTDSLGDYAFSGLGALVSGTSYVVAEQLPSGWTETSPSSSTASTTVLSNGVRAYIFPVSDGGDEIVSSSGNTEINGSGSVYYVSNNAGVGGQVSANDGAVDSFSLTSTVFDQLNCTYTPSGGGSAVSFYTYCIDLFHDFSQGQTINVYVSGNVASAFINGARMAYIYDMYGASNLTGNPYQAAAVQLALWDLTLNNHNPTTFSLDSDGTYSSGDESVYSVKFNNSTDAAGVAPLVNQYLQASIGAITQGGWLNADANGTSSGRGQSLPFPSPLDNFGNTQPVTVAGTVYEDKNDNGVLDSGEPGISGVTLTLSGTNGQGQAITATTTTGSGGSYSFTTDSNGNVLLSGTYQIVESVPSGYLARAATVGTINGTSTGTASSTTTIGSVVLNSGVSGINYNFGDIKPVTIGGLVYQDTNGSGVYNSGNDAGISGVTLTLSGTNDQGTSITASTTTGAGGTFSFATDSSGNVLRPGTYTITETLSSGYLAVSSTVGTVNGSADGSLVSTTKIGSVVIAVGQTGSIF